MYAHWPMQDLERFHQWCAEGTLIRPDAERRNLVDLARALAGIAGALNPTNATPGAGQIAEQIGMPDHLVFVLIDGMGKALFDLLPGDSFLRTNCAATLTSVFPSTTAAALTSLVTGTWPGTHSVLGWWVYFRAQTVCATILPFVERYSGGSLAGCGVTPELAFPRRSMLPDFRYAPLSLVPENINASTYSRYSGGGTSARGYSSVRDGFDSAVAHAKESAGPTYTYLYLPHLDSLLHRSGPEHTEVRRLIVDLDRECARLREHLPTGVRMVVSADHGHAALPPEQEFVLEDGDLLLDLLQCPPSCEPTVPTFHVIPGKSPQFADAFHERYGDMFALLSTEQVDQLQLFGPEPISATARARAGDFLAIAPKPTVLHYLPTGSKRGKQRSVHAGLTPQEMLIPLVVA